MATNPPGQAFPNKTRVAILAELEKERRRLLSTPGARPSLKDFRDNAEQQHIAAQQKAALQHAHTHSSGFFITQDSSFGNLILPVIPRLEPTEPKSKLAVEFRKSSLRNRKKVPDSCETSGGVVRGDEDIPAYNKKVQSVRFDTMGSRSPCPFMILILAFVLSSMACRQRWA
ncbi:SOSS complex subunit C [Liparis tanakae]|uniref:SOSS complex subunit C n=1 Tax=Liparis tanakae TaxID=230148 RepID=A0A4Z2J947_9TELE|nr:SOSS complex subunit C [Liparis tanakae]